MHTGKELEAHYVDKGRCHPSCVALHRKLRRPVISCTGRPPLTFPRTTFFDLRRVSVIKHSMNFALSRINVVFWAF